MSRSLGPALCPAGEPARAGTLTARLCPIPCPAGYSLQACDQADRPSLDPSAAGRAVDRALGQGMQSRLRKFPLDLPICRVAHAPATAAVYCSSPPVSSPKLPLPASGSLTYSSPHLGCPFPASLQSHLPLRSNVSLLQAALPAHRGQSASALQVPSKSCTLGHP